MLIAVINFNNFCFVGIQMCRLQSVTQALNHSIYRTLDLRKNCFFCSTQAPQEKKKKRKKKQTKLLEKKHDSTCQRSVA